MPKPYDAKRLAAVFKRLLEEHNESYREASLRAGLDHAAVGRYIREEQRPSRGSILVLADHFGVNPNDLLELAGYKPLAIFEREPADLEDLSPSVRALLDDLESIADPVLRRRLAEAVRLLIAGYLDDTSPTTVPELV
jgi:transcriptional regulator with XRE-family HTH domain